MSLLRNPPFLNRGYHAVIEAGVPLLRAVAVGGHGGHAGSGVGAWAGGPLAPSAWAASGSRTKTPAPATTAAVSPAMATCHTRPSDSITTTTGTTRTGSGGACISICMRPPSSWSRAPRQSRTRFRNRHLCTECAQWRIFGGAEDPGHRTITSLGLGCCDRKCADRSLWPIGSPPIGPSTGHR